jgi:alpha-mannosidase
MSMRTFPALAIALALSGTASADTDVDKLAARLAAATELTYDGWKASPDIAKAHIDGDGPARPDFDDAKWDTLKIGESIFPDSCWLRRTIVLPKTYLGMPVSGKARLKLSVDDAGTLWVDGVSKGYFPWDGEFDLTDDAKPGQSFVVAIKAINTGGPLRLLRAHVELTAATGRGGDLRKIAEDLALSMKVGQKLLSFDTYQTSARNKVDPKIDKSAMDRAEKTKLAQVLQTLATRVDADALERGDVARFEASVAEVRQGLAPIGEFAKRFTLFLDANAHIDAAWLWRERETREVCRNTFSSVMNMFAARPDFTYTQSSAAYYDWIETNDPPLFAKIREKAKEGRWEVIGGMWVEPDCNLPSGDSWSRHLLYAKRYFRSKLGADVKIGWNPDSFGYNGNIPQLFKNAGIDAFITQKIGWNATYVFPHRVFWWEARDGSRILTYFPFDYVNEVDDPLRLVDWMRQFEAGSGFTKMLVLFGVGDHGGGPSLEMLARADRLAKLDVYPKIEYGTVGQYLAWLRTHDLTTLPVWKDELYLEYHQGTYTTQARMKEQNRRSEVLLTNAEKFGAFATLAGRRYDGAALEEAWRNVLFNQFHDLLPGSGIREIYIDAADRYKAAQEVGGHELDRALSAIASTVETSKVKGTPLLVFNPLGWTRTDLVRLTLPGEGSGPWSVFDADGKEIASQIVAGGHYAREILFVASGVPSAGYALYELRPTAPAPAKTLLAVAAGSIESRSFAITIDPATGWIAKIVDKRSRRDVVDGPANRLQLLEDKPAQWDAWNIGLTGIEYPSAFRGAEVVESGPVRAVLRLKRDYLKPGVKKDYPTEDFPSSFFTQDVVLYDALDRIDFVTTADWWEEHTMLKVAFPVAVKDTKATFEIPYGSIERATEPTDAWEKAKDEVSGHRWVDLSQDDYGVSLLNRAKYGHDVKGSTIRLSLLRSPKWPDPTADRGKHVIEYALYPHAKRWGEAGTYRRGAEYNAPLLALIGDRHKGTRPPATSFVSVAPDRYVLATVKQAEDSPAWIIRWYDAVGEDGTAELTLPFTPKKAVLTNFLEEDGTAVPVTGNVLRVPTGHHAIMSVKVER